MGVTHGYTKQYILQKTMGAIIATPALVHSVGNIQSPKAAQWPVGHERIPGVMFKQGSVFRCERTNRLGSPCRPVFAHNYTIADYKAGKQPDLRFIVQGKNPNQQFLAWAEDDEVKTYEQVENKF